VSKSRRRRGPTAAIVAAVSAHPDETLSSETNDNAWL
jgi:hypothetical protein